MGTVAIDAVWSRIGDYRFTLANPMWWRFRACEIALRVQHHGTVSLFGLFHVV